MAIRCNEHLLRHGYNCYFVNILSTSLKVYDFDISLILTSKFGHVFRRESFNYPGLTGRNTKCKYSEIIDCNLMSDHIFL